jgi:hypothetical protein
MLLSIDKFLLGLFLGLFKVYLGVSFDVRACGQTDAAVEVPHCA